MGKKNQSSITEDNDDREALSTIDVNVIREMSTDAPPLKKKKKAKSKEITKSWTWDDEKVESLFDKLIEYKS